MFAGLM